MIAAGLFECMEPEPNSGCWIWIRARTKSGYGNVWYERRNRPAHRVSYELLVGPIPNGLDLDHRCCNPACINPAHLEPVNASVNTRRGLAHNHGGHKKHNAFKTHCLRGHAYDRTIPYKTKSGYQSVLRRCSWCESYRELTKHIQRTWCAPKVRAGE